MVDAAPRYQDMDPVPGSVGDVLRLVRTGEATSRSALARVTGLAPSTVGLRVDVLSRLGLVVESGADASRGGRRARSLGIARGAGFVAALDVGAHHTQVSLTDLSGDQLALRSLPAVTRDGPREVVAFLWGELEALVRDEGLAEDRLRGLAIGLPAPIEYPSGRVVLPSFMPSWHGAVIPELFAAHTPVPVLAENDANLLALAEQQAVDRSGQQEHLLAVKLGTRIGCGIISAGRLHRGTGGAAGEISHTAVEGEASIPCICGVPDCLESVAGGGAIAARLRAKGYPVETATDVVGLGATPDAYVADVLREAGTHIGRVLASVVNFFNPGDVVLGGVMSSSAPLVAAVRAEVYQRCLPVVANDLDVRAALSPADAGVRGAARLVLEEVLAPARIQALAAGDDLTASRTA